MAPSKSTSPSRGICNDAFCKSAIKLIKSSSEPYAKQFSIQSNPIEKKSLAIDLSRLCITRCRGSNSGAALVHNTETGEDVGAILWKRPRLWGRNAIATAFGGMHLTATGDKTRADVCALNGACHGYDVKVTARHIRIRPINNQGVGEFLGKANVNGGFDLVFRAKSGETTPFFIEAENYTILDIIKSVFAFGVYPNSIEASDRICRKSLVLSIDDAVATLSLWALIRFCLVKDVFFAKSLPTSFGGSEVSGGP